MASVSIERAQEPPKSNNNTIYADNDDRAAVNEGVFEESEYVWNMFGDNVATTEDNDIVEDDSDMPNDDFCFTEDGSIEAS